MRDSYPFTAATTPSGGRGTRPVNLGSVKVGAGPAARLSVNVAPGQFRMILRRKHASTQAMSKRSSSDQDASTQAPGAASPSCESASAQAPG